MKGRRAPQGLKRPKCLESLERRAGMASAKERTRSTSKWAEGGFPPTTFSASGELPEKNPRPGILHEGAGPPSFGASSPGLVSLLQSGLQNCNAGVKGRRAWGGPKWPGA